MAYRLAIDLGTTYTAAAVTFNGRSEIVTLGNRAAVIPSVVFLREDETILAGEPANRRALTEPGRIAREFKRRIGDPTPFILGGTPYSAEALSARLLSWVVDTVSRLQGGDAEGLVVTHPANWGEYKKDLLRQAVRMAGLPGATYVTEPEAAAIYYSSLERVESGRVVGVYDLGGGTFDAVLLRKEGDAGFEILGEPEGIERLGGIDFDEAVFQHVATNLDGALDELDWNDPAVLGAVGRLREECTAAKETLSEDIDASIPVLLPNVSTEVRITRAEFEAMIRPTLADTLRAMTRAIESAGLRPADVDRFLLVGGSSRIPLVGQLVAAEFARPIAVDAQPKHAVALGAAAVASSPDGAAIAPDDDSARAVTAIGVAASAVGADSGDDKIADVLELETPNEAVDVSEHTPDEDQVEDVAETLDGEEPIPPEPQVPLQGDNEPTRQRPRVLFIGGAAALLAVVALLGVIFGWFGGTETTSPEPTAAGTFAPSDETTAIQALPWTTWLLTSVDAGVAPSSVAWGDGRWAIVYQEPELEDIRFAFCVEPACTDAQISLVDSGDVGPWSSVALGTDAIPIISYYDRGLGDLDVVICGDASCSTLQRRLIDAGGDVGSYNSIAIGSDGLPIISYFDETNRALKAAHCDDTECTSASVFVVDDNGKVGSETSIAIGSDGLPVVSYNDEEGGVLRVAHCDNVECSSAILTTIDKGGIGTSIAIGVEGFPVVSYGVLDPNEVRLAICKDLTCATFDVFTIEGSRGESGTSLAVDPEGIPLVAYHAGGDGLWVARCDSPMCESFAYYKIDPHPEAGLEPAMVIQPSGFPSIAYFSGEDVTIKAATTAP